MSYDHEKVHRLLVESKDCRSTSEEWSRVHQGPSHQSTKWMLLSLDAKLDAILEVVMDGNPLVITKPDADG